MGDELEQVLRGKMLHDVLYAIPISHPIAVEIDRLTEELARYKEALEEYGHKCAKCGSVLQLVRPGKHQCQYCEMESALTAELARYKQGVEVNGYVTGVPDDIDANLYFASGWSRDIGKLKGKVRVLVMPMEDKNE